VLVQLRQLTVALEAGLKASSASLASSPGADGWSEGAAPFMGVLGITLASELQGSFLSMDSNNWEWAQCIEQLDGSGRVNLTIYHPHVNPAGQYV
jgi:hypothetical protein